MLQVLVQAALANRWVGWEQQPCVLGSRGWEWVRRTRAPCQRVLGC